MSRSPIFRRIAASRLSVSILALAMALGSTAPALAVISNEMTVTGSSPGGTDDVSANVTEEVDVENAAPVLSVTKVATFDPGGGPVTANGTTDDVPAGTTITYTYEVTNTGNVGVTDVSLSDDHATDADGALSAFVLGGASGGGGSTDTGGDADWDYLAPGDTVSWTVTYDVTYNDIASGSADSNGVLNNEVTASAGYENSSGNPATITETATAAVDLEAPDPDLGIAKVAYLDDFPATHSATGTGVAVADGSNDNVSVGDTIYYAYTVTNTGNLPISGVTLSDAHNGVVGALTPAFFAFSVNNGDGGGNLSTNSGNTLTILYPGDVAVFTASYVVTQNDVDTLQ